MIGPRIALPLPAWKTSGSPAKISLACSGRVNSTSGRPAGHDPDGEDVAVPVATCGGRSGGGSGAARRSGARPATGVRAAGPVVSNRGAGSPPNGRIRSKRRAVRSATAGVGLVQRGHGGSVPLAILRVRERASGECDHRWSASAEQAVAAGDRGRLGAAGGAELAQDVGHVHRDGLGADEELAPDLAVGAALGDQGEDLGLARGQALAKVAGRGAGAGAVRTEQRAAAASAPSPRAVSAAASAVLRGPRRRRRSRRAPRPWRARTQASSYGRGVRLEAATRPRARRSTSSSCDGRVDVGRPAPAQQLGVTAAPPRRGSRGPTSSRGVAAALEHAVGVVDQTGHERRRRLARSVALRCAAPEANTASVVAASRTRAWKSGCQMPVRVSTIEAVGRERGRLVAGLARAGVQLGGAAGDGDQALLRARTRAGCGPARRPSASPRAARISGAGRGQQRARRSAAATSRSMSSTCSASSHRPCSFERDGVHPARLGGVGNPGRALRLRRGPWPAWNASSASANSAAAEVVVAEQEQRHAARRWPRRRRRAASIAARSASTRDSDETPPLEARRGWCGCRWPGAACRGARPAPGAVIATSRPSSSWSGAGQHAGRGPPAPWPARARRLGRAPARRPRWSARAGRPAVSVMARAPASTPRSWPRTASSASGGRWSSCSRTTPSARAGMARRRSGRRQTSPTRRG